MSLQNNPFYILNVSCNLGRKDIVATSEKISFMLDSEVCLDAQNTLTNLNKRVSAELDWFIDVDAEKLELIRACIKDLKPIPTDGLFSLSRLNATLQNFSLSEGIDEIELGYAILDIDEQYSKLSIDEIADALNDSRSIAKLTPVQLQDVSLGLSKKCNRIRQLITEKLSVLDQDSYVELITMLSEKCIAKIDYDDGVVLSDVIDQYEVRMQPVIEQDMEEIETHIGHIQQLVNDDEIRTNINALIKRVQEWDRFVQPLQIKSQASGMPHEINEYIGSELRNLAVYLHNDKGKTKEALTLVDAMKSVFAELASLSELFESDSDTLNNLLQNEKDSIEISVEMDLLHKLSGSLKSYATSKNVDGFVDRVKKLDVKIKALDLDAETKIKIRESLCNMARNTAVELHNTKNQTSYALTIIEALSSEFCDIFGLSIELHKDTVILREQLSYSRSNQVNSEMTNLGGKVWGTIFLILLIFLAIQNSLGGPVTLTNSPSSSPETKFSSSSAYGSDVYADIGTIFPEIGIYTEGSSKYSHFVCECMTSSGSKVWVYMTVSEYTTNFDSSVSTSLNSSYANEITLSPPARIHGITREADTIIRDLSSDTGTVVIEFLSKE